VAAIVAGKAECGGIVERTPGNGVALVGASAVHVGEQRSAEGGVRGRPLGARPAIVGAGHALVDFLPGVLANVVDKHSPRAWLESKGERVAQSQRPNGAVRSRGRVEKRIVGGNAAVLVDPEHFAEAV